jgi:O-acetyl-ADP-ribose deacetylase (regulator of RNase III)
LDKEGLEGVQTIAIPALGCGLGGLNWEEVKTIILEELGNSGKTLILFPPK